MKRTQIYIDEEIFDLLEQESKSVNKSISEIIRESIRDRYSNNSSAIIKKLDNIFGIWKDRDFDTDTYIRDMRKDREI